MYPNQDLIWISAILQAEFDPGQVVLFHSSGQYIGQPIYFDFDIQAFSDEKLTSSE